jgi:hypothetical protein
MLHLAGVVCQTEMKMVALDDATRHLRNSVPVFALNFQAVKDGGLCETPTRYDFVTGNHDSHSTIGQKLVHAERFSLSIFRSQAGRVKCYATHG